MADASTSAPNLEISYKSICFAITGESQHIKSKRLLDSHQLLIIVQCLTIDIVRSCLPDVDYLTKMSGSHFEASGQFFFGVRNSWFVFAHELAHLLLVSQVGEELGQELAAGATVQESKELLGEGGETHDRHRTNTAWEALEGERSDVGLGEQHVVVDLDSLLLGNTLLDRLLLLLLLLLAFLSFGRTRQGCWGRGVGGLRDGGGFGTRTRHFGGFFDFSGSPNTLRDVGKSLVKFSIIRYTTCPCTIQRCIATRNA